MSEHYAAAQASEPTPETPPTPLKTITDMPADAPTAALPPTTAPARSRPWWQSTWATLLALVLILLLGTYFRFLGLTDWDQGTGQHPDERFFQDVTASVRLPASVEDYFDAAHTPANPRNVGKGFFVYGTFPVHITRLAAVMVTPADLLPETVPNPRAALPGEPADIANPERAIPRIGWLQAWVNPDGKNLTGYGEVVNVGRVVVAVFDVLAIVLVFLIGWQLYDRRVGLLAALLAALAVMSIQQAHFYVEPIFSTFFALFALYWAVRIAQGAGWYAFLLLGVGIGLAMANRITLATLGMVGMVAAAQAALVWYEKARSTTDNRWRAFVHVATGSFLLLCLAGFMTLLTFRIAQPYAFVGSVPGSSPVTTLDGQPLDEGFLGMDFLRMQGAGFFDIRLEPRFIANMQEVARLVSGEADFPPSQQWVGQPSYIFPWRNMVLWGMGPALGITVWVAWGVVGVLLLRRLRATLHNQAPAISLAPLVLWFWVAFYFGWQGGHFVMNMRYMLPIYGALMVLGAWLLVWLWDWGSAAHQRRLEQAATPARASGLAAPEQADTPARRWLRWLRWLRWQTWRQAWQRRWHPDRLSFVRWSLLLVALSTFVWAYAFSRIYTRPHPRVMAAQWVAEHVPPGSKISFEQWDDPLPLNVLGGDPWGTSYRGVQTHPYAEDEPQKYYGNGVDFGLLDHLDEADYISLTSNRVYGSTENLPMRYPALRRYYHYLFNGELGFELAADITSYPTVMGIRIPTQSADESFTVYDHPKVLIFRKTAAFSRERAEELLTQNINWAEVYKSNVQYADRSETALRFTTSEWPLYRAGGTWFAAFDPASIVNRDTVAPLVWLAVLEALGLAMFALLFRLLPWLPDRGLSLARALGLLVVAYAAWLLGSLKLLPFTTSTVWLCAGPLLLAGLVAAWLSRRELWVFVRERRNAILLSYAVYLGAFLLLLAIRWYNPDLWHPSRGGEKPMDFAYLNGVLRSAAFPPVDPWFAGGYINYYYFGFVIVGALIHLTSIVPDVAYNLAVAALFALTAVGAFGAIYNLLAPRSYTIRRREARPPRWWGRLERWALLGGALAPGFLLLLGNLAQPIWFLNGYASENEYRREWAFWDATRIVEGTVNEFPFFTFLFADLHAHMMVMPFSLAVVGLLVALVRRVPAPASDERGDGTQRTRPWLPVGGCLALLGLLAGTLRATNTWDYPTFVGLTIVTLLLLTWWQLRRDVAAARRTPDSPPERIGWLVLRHGLLFVAQVALVVGVGNALFAPFISHFATESSSIELLGDAGDVGLGEQFERLLAADRTSLPEILQLYGFWLFVLLSGGIALAQRTLTRQNAPAEESPARRYIPYLLGALVGIAAWQMLLLFSGNAGAAGEETERAAMPALLLLLPLLAGGVGLLGLLYLRAPRVLMPVLWATTALALCAGVDIVRVQGDVGRMNTVFKFGLHAWMLFALAAAVALPWLGRQAFGMIRRSVQPSGSPGETVVGAAWSLAALVLLLASLVYPLTATPARIADRFTEDLPHTLNGAAFLEDPDVVYGEAGTTFRLNEDLAAIRWLRQNITGTPIILEAHLPSYRWAGRVSVYTGLPTLYGWEWHQIQQRGAANSGAVLSNRKEAINQIYGNPDPVNTIQLLRLYGIEYVYVGGVERALYSPESLEAFTTLAAQGALEQVYNEGNTTIYRVLDVGTPTVLTSDLAVVAPVGNTPPLLRLDQPVNELPAVGGFAWNAQASSNAFAALALWLAAMYGLWLLGLPLAVSVFGSNNHTGGVGWARVLGLLLLGYAVWLPASYGAWHYDTWGITGGLGLVLLLNGWLLLQLGRQHDGGLLRGLVVVGRHLAQHRTAMLVGELLFIAGLVAFAGVRMFNPDLWHPVWGGEKPMEFGFLNAIMRSPVMPPYDPFFSDGYINYYYYGFFLLSLPIKLTGIAPAVAYNLALATLVGLTLAGAYTVVGRLTGRRSYGLLGAVFVALLGNLAAVIPAGWSRGLPSVFELIGDGGLGDLGARLGDWYVGPSRVIQGTINEFPYFSYLYADLHPHMIALPITLLAIALAYRLLTMARDEPRLLPFLTVALTLGTLAVTNSWDYPPYTLLVGAALVGAAWRSQRRGIPWRSLAQAVGLAALLGLGGMVLYTPFFDHFSAMVGGVGQVAGGTRISEYLLLYGLFLLLVLPFVLGAVWRLASVQVRFRRLPRSLRTAPPVVGVVLLAGLCLFALSRPVQGLHLWLGVLILCGVVFYFQRRLSAPVWFLLLLLSLVWCVSLGIDYIYIRDHMDGGDFYRMNTVFKFGYQLWTLLALVAAASLPYLRRGLARFGEQFKVGARPLQAVGLTVVGLVLLLGLVYPLVGTPSKLADRFPESPPPTLDGLAFLSTAEFTYPCDVNPGCEPGVGTLEINLLPDAEAIAWLNENIEGTPIVVQSPLWFYRAYGIRVAANTGLPTVISGLHVDEQRDPAVARARDRDVDALFRTTEIETALRILARYRVNYVYVGAIETAFYSAAALQKFQAMVGTYLEVVYNTPGAKIYRVSTIPSVYAQPAPYDFEEEQRQPGSPPPDPLQGEVLRNEEGQEPLPPLDDLPLEPSDDLAILEQQVADNPTSGPLAFGLGDRYRNLGRLEDAEAVLARAAEANPDDIALHHLWGDVLAALGRYVDAEAAYRHAAERSPTAANWNKLGTELLRWGEIEKAHAAVEQALDADSMEPEPHFRMAQIMVERGNPRRAMEHLQTFLNIAPDHYLAPEAHTLLGELDNDDP